jgi:hypothetical protein
MELDLQSLFGLHVRRYSILNGLNPATPPHPSAFGLIYKGAIGQAKIDDISLWPPVVNYDSTIWHSP